MFDFGTRIKRLQQKLKNNNLDAVVVVTNEANNKNIYYLTGFGGTTGALIVSQTDLVLAVDGRYTIRAKEESASNKVIQAQFSREITDFSNYITPAIKEFGFQEETRVGYEGSRISANMLSSWKDSLGVDLIATDFFIEELRQKKDRDEINLIKEANDVTSEVIEKCIPYIKEGMTEKEVARKFDITLRENGAISNSFSTIVASGPNAAVPHHETSNRTLNAGESVVIDFGGLFTGGYCSDITRTVFVPGTEPDVKLKEIYTIVLEANRKARVNVRPGMLWKEYDALARDYIAEKGYGEYFSHGLGHSIGLDVHDPYNYGESPFEEGTVMSDEPGIYIPELGGVRIEDDIVITKDGGVSLTKAPYLSL